MRVIKFLQEFSKHYCLYLWGIFFVIFVASLATNAKPYIMKLLIDNVSQEVDENIWFFMASYGVFQVLMILAWTLSDALHVKYAAPFKIHILHTFTNKISTYSYSFFQNNLTGSLSAKAGEIYNFVQSIVITIHYQFVQFALTTFITLFLLGKIHVFFAYGLFLWVLIFLWITFVSMKKVIPLTQAYAESKATVWGHLADYLTNMLNVKLFATLDWEKSHSKRMSKDFIRHAQTQARYLMKFYALQGLIVTLYTLGFLMLLIYLKNKGLITPGDFALVFMLNYIIGEKLYDLSHQLREFITNWGSVDQALSLFDTLADVQDTADAKPLKVLQGGIEFKKITYGYKGSAPLFQNFSINLQQGQKIGLVGYSGGGKTTFVNLILRLYDLSSGQILIDGQDISHVTQDSLRAAIAMIPQDPSLFHRSIMENIRYGRQDATDEEVIEASKGAHAHEFIISLVQGYDSLVGERGIKLSGGQRQRIAIARAILKNSPIFIFDEATSQLDSLTETAIQESIGQVMQNKTTLVIAHRLATLLKMDRILVFKEGKILEDGNHDQLLEQKGLYKNLWDAQVGGFLPQKPQQ